MNPTTLTGTKTFNDATNATQQRPMDAVVLERQHEIQVRPVPGLRPVGSGEVRIGVHTVGICGSDVHYFTHGKIDPYVVESPMVLSHEASGTVLEAGEGVDHLAVGTGSAWSRASPTRARGPRGWACTTWTRTCSSGPRPGRRLPPARDRAPRRLHLQAARAALAGGGRPDRALRRGGAGGRRRVGRGRGPRGRQRAPGYDLLVVSISSISALPAAVCGAL